MDHTLAYLIGFIAVLVCFTIYQLTELITERPVRPDFRAERDNLQAKLTATCGVCCASCSEMLAEDFCMACQRDKVQRLNLELAERCAKQSELLSKKAEGADL